MMKKTRTLVILLILSACKSPESQSPVLTAEVPLHLEDHLAAATIIGSEVPVDIREPVEWNFDQRQPYWKPIPPLPSPMVSPSPATVEQTEAGLRIRLNEANDHSSGSGRPDLGGGIFTELPDWRREDWSEILVRVRTSDNVRSMSVGLWMRQEMGPRYWERFRFRYGFGDNLPVISDGSVQTYTLRADWSPDYAGQWEDPWRHLGISFWAREPVAVEILSVKVIPKETVYSGAKAGVKTENRNQAYRRTLYTHTPVTLQYPVRVPAAGRLDVGLGVLRADTPVKFRISAELDDSSAETLFEESYADAENWAQRRVDLSEFAGRAIILKLEAEADRSGTVALWAAPTLSGSRDTSEPNIIFYVIDGASADHMSVYGFNRRTTPNLERLAAEGALFEQAYSNSTWTRPSTPSFLTSLHSSTMGGIRDNHSPPPEDVLTISEHLHSEGYQTALFTSNPNAATMSNLDRGVDALREKSVDPTSHSTRELHREFWDWRRDYPGEPFWVHFQPTDVHGPHNPPTPFAGLFVNAERRKKLQEWWKRLSQRGSVSIWGELFERAGVDRIEYCEGWHDLYCECMAHQDHQIGRLVERLKSTGEWENTLLIIASDHGATVVSNDHDIGMMDPLPTRWRPPPMLRPGFTRIPMIFVFPGRIPPGQRFREPVSMIDMLPTILDLVDLPLPEVMQGQSLAPLLLGKDGWEPRPIILDEFSQNARTGKLSGRIEVVDGRWGASLEIDQDPEEDVRPLLIFDLWNDPECLESLHEKRPDLVEQYREFLEKQFEAHQNLASHLTHGSNSPLSPEQLKALQALGYIR